MLQSDELPNQSGASSPLARLACGTFERSQGSLPCIIIATQTEMQASLRSSQRESCRGSHARRGEGCVLPKPLLHAVGIMGRLRVVYAQLPWSQLPLVPMTSSSFRAAYARLRRSFASVTNIHTTETFTRDIFEAFISHLENFRNRASMGAAPFPAVIATKLAGNWRKDKSNSDVDCYARQLDLLQIQGIQKACALKLINGLQIESDQECE